MPSSADTLPNTIRIKLVKQRHGGLGFLVRQRSEKPFVVVAELVAGGIAEESGLVQVGDVVLRLNDISLAEMSYESALEVLKAVPVEAPVVMLLRGPEGCTTHLETTFMENGLPRTIRVTKPIPPDTLMGRIRRTFTNGAPSPVRTLKKMWDDGEKQNGSATALYHDDDDLEINADAAGLGSADSGYASSAVTTSTEDEAYGGGGGGGRQKVGEGGGKGNETVLDRGAKGSPKIVLTAPRARGTLDPSPARRSGSASRRAIEIVQDNDQITVVVKGDVRIHSEAAQPGNGPDSSQHSFVISSSYPAPSSGSQSPPSRNGHLQAELGNPVDHAHLASGAESDVSDNEEKVLAAAASRSSRSPGNRRRSTERRGSSATSPKKFVKVHNLLDEKATVDVLHQKIIEPVTCTPERCMGSMMQTAVKTGPPRKPEDILVQAKDFIEQYYASIKRQNTAAHQKRWQEVQASIEKTGNYDLTTAELSFGAKTGWRNAPRCIGRIQWSKLQLFDARHITTARGMYEALCNHIKYGTNKGNIRAAITIFPQRTKGRGDYRVWNSQLITYAGYRQPDGTFLGDPKNVEFTELVMKMGWKPPKNPSDFDVLPLILSAAGQDPEMFEIPPELILEVSLKHPKYPWFGELGLKWYALPAVSGMLFDCGGLEFTACPFNGWYMGTEIGARDLCDVNRYNILEKVAVKMGLDVRKSSSLWKDRALVEVNIAVLHSYQMAGVAITDHHAAAESFMKHLENEQRLRGGCPGDWVWVVPPMSGSITPVFHQEMLNYKLKPSYEYQEEPWKTHVWKKDREKPKTQERSKRKFGFRELARSEEDLRQEVPEVLHEVINREPAVAEHYPEDWQLDVTPFGRGQGAQSPPLSPPARDPPREVQHLPPGLTPDQDGLVTITAGKREGKVAVKFSAKLMGRALARRVKCTIMYATETGKSERFANTLCEIFKHAFDAKVVCMDAYDTTSLEHESLVLIVTSTFGNGDPPENGESLAKGLYELKHPEKSGSANFSSSSYIRMTESGSDHGGDDEETDHADNISIVQGPLSNVRFSVFALGSRAYPHFAAFGHYMNKILTELGAECIHSIVEGDELCGQEESFRNWAQTVFKAACETFCLGDDVNITEATGALSNTDYTWTPGRFRLTPVDVERDAEVCAALSTLHGKRVLPCRLTERVQLQSRQSPRQTILAKLNTQDSSELQYSPGDHLGIFPANPPVLVEAILSRLHNAPPPDQVVKTEVLSETSTPLGVSKNWTQFEKMPLCSMRTALTHILDVTTPPSQAFLQLLATLASRNYDQERLEMLAKDSKQYEDWRYENCPNLLEVLDQFPSLRVPPSLLMTQLPLLQQRFYSISSSPMECVGEIHATIAVVNYRTQNGAGPIHEGVCSGWLNRCDIGETVPCVVRAAPAFRLPEDQTLPVIMVGPGTGVAPFRSFWQQRKIDMEMKPIPSSGDRKCWGEMYLYFGCRQDSMDNIYKEELAQMKAEGVLTDYYLALSREPGQPKVYVQDILMRSSSAAYDVVAKKGGHFYVCGDVSMANDVTKTLEQILSHYGAMKPDQAKNFVLKLKDANRFHEDIFGVSVQRSSEAGDKSRDQGQRAWKFIDSPIKPGSSKEVAQALPLPEKKATLGKPRAPVKNIFVKQREGPASFDASSSP